MRQIGLRGAIRGRAFKVTTVAKEGAERPQDLAYRDLSVAGPTNDPLWVVDISYGATWVGYVCGYVCVAFLIDVFSRRIVADAGGWLAGFTVAAQ